MTSQDDLLPVGLEDALPARARTITSAMRAVLDAMDAHGYDRVRPPLVEFEHSLAGRMDGVATRRMVRFTDPDSLRTLALRSDMTVQVGRIAATGMATAPRPLRPEPQRAWARSKALGPGFPRNQKRPCSALRFFRQ